MRQSHGIGTLEIILIIGLIAVIIIAALILLGPQISAGGHVVQNNL
jgi:Flp pilus assembly pilin Flp